MAKHQHCYSTLRRRSGFQTNPTAKKDVPCRQVAKLLGSSNGRKRMSRGLGSFFSEKDRDQFVAAKELGGDVDYGVVDGTVVGEVVECAEMRATKPEAAQPLDGVCARVYGNELVLVRGGGLVDRHLFGEGWSFC